MNKVNFLFNAALTLIHKRKRKPQPYPEQALHGPNSFMRKPAPCSAAP